MPIANFVLNEGQTRPIEIPNGKSLMLAAVGGGISEIVAECGGVMSCASCHVVVDPAFREICPPISPTEDQMLDFTVAPREAGSRLSCQLVMTDAMSGITVRVASPQV